MAANEALKSLHTSLIDAANGYDEAVKDADDPAMTDLFETMASIHHTAHDEVHAILTARGVQPDDAGSFMSTVHKTVISVRSAITGLNRASLGAFADGEKRLVSAYDDAIAENRDDPSTVEKLARRKTELAGMAARLQEKAATAP